VSLNEAKVQARHGKGRTGNENKTNKKNKNKKKRKKNRKSAHLHAAEK